MAPNGTLPINRDHPGTSWAELTVSCRSCAFNVQIRRIRALVPPEGTDRSRSIAERAAGIPHTVEDTDDPAHAMGRVTETVGGIPAQLRAIFESSPP